MHSKKITIPSLYFNGLVQGIGFTTIPAAGNFLTSAKGFNFTTSEYGILFIPMIVGSILASFFGGVLAKKTSLKLVMIICGIFNILSMLLFSSANLFIDESHYAFFIMLICMLCLGLGFGGNLTALNTYAIQFFPNKTSTAVTGLHSCLGIGTALGPLLLSYFMNRSIWWADGLMIAAIYSVLLIITALFYPSHVVMDSTTQNRESAQNKKGLLILFILIALVYGICETTFGNWGTIFLHHEKGMSESAANAALSIFWGSITAARILVFALSFKVSTRLIYRFLAPIILVSLIAIQLFSEEQSEALFFGIFALAGIGCSAFLPLTVSFAGKQFLSNAEEVSGEVLSFYLLGYGIASIGIGLVNKIEEATFQTIFLWLALPVFLLSLLCFYVTKKNDN